MPAKTQQQFFKISEIAEILDVSERTIRRRVGDKSIAAHKVGRQYRISRTDLEEYLRSNRCSAAPSVL